MKLIVQRELTGYVRGLRRLIPNRFPKRVVECEVGTVIPCFNNSKDEFTIIAADENSVTLKIVCEFDKRPQTFKVFRGESSYFYPKRENGYPVMFDASLRYRFKLKKH